MLSVRGLSKTYTDGGMRVEALRNVDVDIEDGEIFGFIGLSGAGKTSLARCISLLETADAGAVMFEGEDLTKLRGAKLLGVRKKIGLVFQHFNLLMHSTVFDNIAFPLKIAKRPKAEIRDKVMELLELVGLLDKKDTYPSKLSGGQKQRVGIARALAGQPKLIICDEATSALDPDTTKSILELIKHINRQTGVTVIVITHEMDVIKTICNRVAIMEDGRIIELGKVIDVLAQPKTDTARRFFLKEDAKSIEALASALGRNEKLMRAVFLGDSAMKPFISDIIRKFDVDLSILSGGIENVGDAMMGALYIKLSGSDEAVASSIQYFRDGGVGIEVINNAS